LSYVIVAELLVKEDCIDAFAAAIDRHAHNSRTLEQGCLVFDVCQHQHEPQRFVFYEVYRDEAAYQIHRQMTSYREFFENIDGMLIPGTDGSWTQSRRVLCRRAAISA
jgi:quinol monooxygenase YgiN